MRDDGTLTPADWLDARSDGFEQDVDYLKRELGATILTLEVDPPPDVLMPTFLYLLIRHYGLLTLAGVHVNLVDGDKD